MNGRDQRICSAPEPEARKRADRDKEIWQLVVVWPERAKPDLFDFNRRLIHTPGVIAGFEMSSAVLFHFWRILLNPTEDGCMIDRELVYPLSIAK